MNFPFDRLDEDITADLPSGPDLEFEGDPDFMRFIASIDGVLPATFAGFDRAGADLPSHIATVASLVTRSKDLRLITSAAKLFILDREFAGFVDSVAAAARWVRDRWDTVLPELLDGDAVMRAIALQSLDDVPHTVKPLEAAPLFRSKRLGQVSLRASLLAEGRLAPRQASEGEGEAERVPSPSDILSAIRETSLEELVAQRALAVRLVEALADLETLFDEKSGQPGVLRFGELKPKAAEVRDFLDRAVALQDPSQALAPAGAAADGESGGGDGDEPGTAAISGDVTTLPAACAAMAAAARYFQRHEPSSPVRLILAQAEALVGKGFFESLQLLMPEIAGQATVALGRDLPIRLPFERLAQLLPYDAPTEGYAEQADGDASPGDESSWDSAPEPPPQPAFHAGSRQQALALLDKAAGYFRAAEPSSAIPMLFDIARGTVGRDFLSLVRDVMPAQTLRVDE